VHECLAERWPRLARWRSEDAADRALLGDVTTAARRWIEADRRDDLLWRGEALAELSRLAARSTSLTTDERAFADAAVHAQTRARRVRRAMIGTSMLVLAGVAVVMAYLSLVANENRAEAERSAKQAADAATLAEQRLTQSLIAQGRRELNDGRDMQALAYFAAALERGGDSPALRQMISIAGRGWPHILGEFRGDGGRKTVVTLVGSPDGTMIGGDSAGNLYWWNDSGELLGELKTELQSITGIELDDDGSILVAGMKGFVLVDKSRTLLRSATVDAQPWYGRHGPELDEVTLVTNEGVTVFDWTGTPRRDLKIENSSDSGEPMLDVGARHALYLTDNEVHVVDLVTMKDRVVARDARYEMEGALDGSRFAYIDKDFKIHVIRGDGTEITKVDVEARPHGLVFSDEGARLGVPTEQRLFVFDETGKEVTDVPIKPEQSTYALRGDEVWVTNREGTVRHFVNGLLVASVPVHASEIRFAVIARGALATMGTDSVVTFVRSDARQVFEEPDLCKQIQFGSQGIAMQYTCDQTSYLYMGRKKLGEYPLSQAYVQVAYESAYEKTAIAADLGVRVFDGNAKRGPIAITSGSSRTATSSRSGGSSTTRGRLASAACPQRSAPSVLYPARS
jgi:hypothetical protein